MGEELNAAEVTERGLVGDRQFAVVDASTGKVAGAKNPRKWGSFFDFRAAYVEPPEVGSKLPAVRVTLPDGTVVRSEQPDLARVLSTALGREVTFATAEHKGESSGAQAEEYWPDMEGRRRLDRAGSARFRRERLDRSHGRSRRQGSPADHRSLPALRDDDTASGRPAEGCRHSPHGSTEQPGECGGLRGRDRGRPHSARRLRHARMIRQPVQAAARTDESLVAASGSNR
jgi:hypothetical protein